MSRLYAAGFVVTTSSATTASSGVPFTATAPVNGPQIPPGSDWSVQQMSFSNIGLSLYSNPAFSSIPTLSNVTLQLMIAGAIVAAVTPTVQTSSSTSLYQALFLLNGVAPLPTPLNMMTGDSCSLSITATATNSGGFTNVPVGVYAINQPNAGAILFTGSKTYAGKP